MTKTPNPTKRSTSPRVAKAKMRGQMEKFVSYPTSKIIKKEILDDLSEQQRYITPDAKMKERRPKRDHVKKIHRNRPQGKRKDREMKQLENDEHIQSKGKDSSSENAYSVLCENDIEKLLKYKDEDLYELVQAWKKRKGQQLLPQIEKVAQGFLHIALEDAKHEAESEKRITELRHEFDKEASEYKKKIQNMRLNSKSTMEEIRSFSKKDLVNFIYYKSINTPQKIDPEKTMRLSEEEVCKLVSEYINPECVKDQGFSSSSETKLQATFKINETLQDDEIRNANLETLRNAYYEYSMQTGERVQKTVIEQWDKEFLCSICINKRDSMKLQKMITATTKNDRPTSVLRNPTKKKLAQSTIRNPNVTKGTCRYSLYFRIPENFKGTEGLREFLSLIFTEMILYGKDLCLLPWSTEAITDPINDVESLPTTITGLKKYFDGAKSPESSEHIYTKIRLGYSLQMQKVNFDADVQGWCKAQSIRMYQCSVQHPHVKSCAWLVYCPRTLNTQKWCQKVVQMYESTYGNKQKQPFQIGLTWRALNGQYDVPRNEKLRAMHVDAPIESASEVKNFLRIISQKKKWPLNVRFRVMDEYHRYMKDSTKQKYRYMVSKHKALMKQIGMCECNQIINLDRQIGTSNMTLREIVQNIRDNTDNFRIFASIDEKWNSDTMYVATYRPDKSTKAYDFMRSLSTYVKYLFPDASLKRIFTLEAIEKAKDETYNPTSQTFTTKEDIDLDLEIQADLDDDSFDFIKPEEGINPYEFDDTIKLVGGEPVWNFNGDEDTISTTQPQGMGNVSFNSTTCRYYDPGSCSSSIQSTTDTSLIPVKRTPLLQNHIAEEIKNLTATEVITHQVNATAEVADSK